jgi:hypothetical protein
VTPRFLINPKCWSNLLIVVKSHSTWAIASKT